MKMSGADTPVDSSWFSVTPDEHEIPLIRILHPSVWPTSPWFSLLGVTGSKNLGTSTKVKRIAVVNQKAGESQETYIAVCLSSYVDLHTRPNESIDSIVSWGIL